MTRSCLWAVLGLFAIHGAARAEPAIAVLALGFEAEQLRGPATRVAQTVASVDGFRDLRAALKAPMAVAWGREGAAALTLEAGAVRVVRSKSGGDLGGLERGRDALPDARIGGVGGLSAQLEMPSRDYAHNALGSPIQAKVLAITERKPSAPTSEPKPVAQDVVRIAAGEDAVFEDREPHFVDLGRDGLAIAVVRSYRDRGSALLLVAKREGAWRVLAETPPDGEPFRWLNPATSGDKGATRDLAVVRRPHLDGLLQIWRVEGDRLVLRGEKAGYSNHAFGSAAQDLAVWYVGETGSARLAVPVLDRHALAILEFEPEVREIARISLPGKAKTGVTALGRGRDVHLLVGLEDGRVVDVRP